MASLTRLLIAAALLPGFSAPTFAAEKEECIPGNADRPAQIQCVAKRIRVLDTELNKVYQAAIATLPESGANDARKNREQLRKSQRAWLKYRLENCALTGGLEGGLNSSVSYLAALCEEQETESRIEFLKSIANGSIRN